MRRRQFMQGMGLFTAGCLCGIRHAGAETLTWGYSGATGPENWSELSPYFETCSMGQQQSPINITRAEKRLIPRLDINWKPLSGKIVNTGYTIQIEPEEGGVLSLNGAQYTLLQAHFHTPSEHMVDGKQFPLEIHFVHRHPKTHTLAVLGVLMEGGGAHSGLEAIMRSAPKKKGEQAPAPEGVDLRSLVPETRSYWTYAGSLTTPPCSEQVNWMVCEETVQVSDADIEAFRALYPMNARPVQDVNRRSVFMSE